MNNHQLILFFLALCLTTMPQAKAQASFGTTGGELNGAGGSISLSVGQYLSDVRLGDMTTLQLGVQQAFEISVVTSTEDILLELEPTVFPNPSPGIVYLKLNPNQQKTFQYQVFSIRGQLLEQGPLLDAINPIDLSQHKAQRFLISLSSETKILKTFKVIKP